MRPLLPPGPPPLQVLKAHGHTLTPALWQGLYAAAIVHVLALPPPAAAGDGGGAAAPAAEALEAAAAGSSRGAISREPSLAGSVAPLAAEASSSSQQAQQAQQAQQQQQQQPALGLAVGRQRTSTHGGGGGGGLSRAGSLRLAPAAALLAAGG